MDGKKSFRKKLKYAPWACEYCPAKFYSLQDALWHFETDVSLHASREPSFIEELDRAREAHISKHLGPASDHQYSPVHVQSESDVVPIDVKLEEDDNCDSESAASELHSIQFEGSGDSEASGEGRTEEPVLPAPSGPEMVAVAPNPPRVPCRATEVKRACGLCGRFVGGRRETLHNHIVLHHLKEPTFSCRRCDFLWFNWSRSKAKSTIHLCPPETEIQDHRPQLADSMKAMWALCFPFKKLHNSTKC